MCRRKTWQMTVLAFGVLTLMAIISGCQAFLPQSPVADSEQGTRLQAHAIGPATEWSRDDLTFGEVARRAPGFGGMFFDERGNLNVYLLDAVQKVAAETAIAAVFGSDRIPAGGIQVLLGRYDFLQLLDWYSALRDAVFAIPGVVRTDINEAKNRLTVGVEDIFSLAPLVEAELTKLGIPREAVDIEEAGQVQFATTIQQKFRPVRGGLQISNTVRDCTLGFNAKRAGVTGFITNSHCTLIKGGIENTVFHQPSYNNRIGIETADPIWSSCTRAPHCRISDSAFAKYDSGVWVDFGYIVKLSGKNSATASILIDKFRITSERPYPTGGETLEKIGKTTGWMTGGVVETCVDYYISEGGTTYLLSCQDVLGPNVNTESGDSGGPVFQITNSPSTNDVKLYGVITIREELIGSVRTGFSAIWNIEAELGSLTTCYNSSC